jgi:hypothetical protein
MITISLLEYESLKRELSELHLLVQQLRDEISLLKGGKNSRTSSTSPSQDLGRSNRISLRTPSGKKPGGQPGHTGYTLPMSDTPDEIIDHHPRVCNHCGEELEKVVSSSFTRRQIVDIPPIFPIYIEHRSHTKICPMCSFQNKGLFPRIICIHRFSMAPALRLRQVIFPFTKVFPTNASANYSGIFSV